MPRQTQIDVPALFRLWNDASKGMTEVARDLGVSDRHLRRVARERALPERAYCYRPPATREPQDDGNVETLELSPYVQERIRVLGIGPWRG